MSLEDDMNNIAARARLHTMVDSIPDDARFVFAWENHHKEVEGHTEGEDCEKRCEIIISANCTYRDVVYIATLIQES